MAILFKSTLKATLDGQLCELVFHFKDSSDLLTETAVNDLINDNMMFPLAYMQSNEVLWTEIATQKLYPALGDPVSRTLAFPGQDGDPAAASVLAMVVSMKTGLGGRRNRGRKFLFGFPSNWIDNSLFTQEALTAAAQYWGQIHTAFKPGNAVSALNYGILHRVLGGQLQPPTPANFVDVTQVIPRNYVATMRSRRPGHGN